MRHMVDISQQSHIGRGLFQEPGDQAFAAREKRVRPAAELWPEVVTVGNQKGLPVMGSPLLLAHG
ncbi:MAG: hypothetical protein NDI73_11965 [Desulfuromonadales bacterium]|nr:hypothetical protein [Desulfuromonadales bacterium]